MMILSSVSLITAADSAAWTFTIVVGAHTDQLKLILYAYLPHFRTSIPQECSSFTLRLGVGYPEGEGLLSVPKLHLLLSHHPEKEYRLP